MDIKLKIDNRRQLSDGRFPVKLFIKRGLMVNTGVKVFLDEWDSAASRCVGPAKRYNATLMSMQANAVIRLSTLTPAQLNRLSSKQIVQLLSFDAAQQVVDGITASPIPIVTPALPSSLGEIYGRVVATKRGRTKELYQDTYAKLQQYVDVYQTSFDDITRLWLDGFVASMGGLSVNTKAIHLRNLRNVVNYAIDEGITTLYAFRRWSIPREETRMRVLTRDDVAYLREIPLTGMLAEYRDIFMLTFYLIGINLVDMSRLTKKNVVRDRLEYRRAKTGKLYSIKLEPEAIEIIERYKGIDHLLAPFDRYNHYKDYAKRLTAGIRKLLPHQPDVSLYWARYTWATTAAEIDVNRDTISEALGHSYGSRVTSGYIKYNRAKVDKANRDVIDYICRK